MADSYQNILVPVDGSAPAKKAFEEAVQVAKRNQGKLTLLTVIDTTTFSGTTGASSIKILKEAQAQAHQILADLANEPEVAAAKIRLKTNVAAGNPKREIVEFADQIEADLILMGATGRSALERVFIGSTASYVVNRAACNVMVVK